jgi:aspartyl-tRNA(Asn)/glutamyl-tRNA(Gln) amidotransferase subunit B
MTDEFKTVIGLEIHIQLNTKSKMFCSCDNNAHGRPANELTCPICMGMPGTLPVANKQAIKKTITMGLVLNCEIAKFSKFDRKHYFYPDLPKGYQISQFDKPLCVGGEIILDDKKVRLNRIHLEEDAGKLVHPLGGDYSIVDLNRAGTPLMEIVTEPDMTSPGQAADFLRELQKIAKAIGVSNADMEKGHLRCDANINVIRDGKSSPIIEIKNLNSFKFVSRALEFERRRLIDEFDSFDGKKTKQTRGFDSNSGKTYVLRTKEEAKDYRYFPEPDLPPIEIEKDNEFNLDKIRAATAQLPQEARKTLLANGIGEKDAEVIVKNLVLGSLFNDCVNISRENIPAVAKFIINQKNLIGSLSARQIVDIVALQKQKNLSSNIVKAIIESVTKNGESVADAYGNLSKISVDIDSVVNDVLLNNPDVVEKYKSGKKEVVGFLVGQVMKQCSGKANPNEAKQSIEKKLS